MRYDYVPERSQDPEHPYPASHVHVNATNGSYDEFMASTVLQDFLKWRDPDSNRGHRDFQFCPQIYV